MRKNLSIGVGVGTLLALSLGAALPANADIQPNSTDVVGVGSDTVQYVGDFLNDGYNGGSFPQPGYNTSAKVNRIFSFDATADAAGRAQYSPNGNPSGSTKPFQSAVVLRQGDFPYFRAQGSGDGIKDLINDAKSTVVGTAGATGPFKIDFVRASRKPNATEQADMAKALYGSGTTQTMGIHVFQVASDGLDMAVNNKAANVTAGDPLTCMPAAGLATSVLTQIYDGTIQTWGAIPGYVNPAGSTCSTEPIAPMAPDQAASGTGGDFFKDMAGTNTTYAYNSRVIKVEEHDPSALGRTGTIATTGSATPVAFGPQDAIAPFSRGRYNLIQSGYFDHVLDIHAPGTSTVLKDSIAIQTPGTGSVAAGSYTKARFLYILVKETDVASTTPFLPGGTKNWVDTFFRGTLSQYGKAASASLYTAAGVTQAYSDLGLTT